VKNIGTKALGCDSHSKRSIKALITCGEGLNFGRPSEDPETNEYEIPVKLLEGNQEETLKWVAKISPDVLPYHRLQARVALQLTPPDLTDPGTIQFYDLSIQVVNSYVYDPQSAVLLVTNLRTTASEVMEWAHLIRDKLKLKMDIFNLSLSGHLETVLPGDSNPTSLFELYRGKTVVLLADPFPYFERGERNALDMVDGDKVSRAMSCGTSLLVMNSTNGEDSPHIPRLLRTESYPLVLTFQTTKQLVKAILNMKDQKTFYQTRFICTPKAKTYQTNRCLFKANKAALELHRRIPNVRFLVFWAPTPGRREAGKVEILPCITYNASKFLISQMVKDGIQDEVKAFSILFSLPFSTRLEMLWDKLTQSVLPEDNTEVKRIIGVVQFDLIIEMGRFTAFNSPWPDNIPSKDMLNSLTRLREFSQFETSRQFSRSSLGPVTTILGNLSLLADFCAGSYPLGLTFGTRRKKLCKKLNEIIDTFLASHYVEVKDRTVQQQLKRYVEEQKKRMRTLKFEDRKAVTLQRIVESIGVRVDIISESAEIMDVELLGNIVREEKDLDIMRHGQQVEQDLAHAKEQVRRMSMGSVQI
jgi:hypothetical protein